MKNLILFSVVCFSFISHVNSQTDSYFGKTSDGTIVLIATEKWDTTTIYTLVEENPEFPGGKKELDKWLAANLKYPAIAREEGIEGSTYIGFVVEKDGSITEVQVKRGIAGGCNEEASRLIKSMPKWKPGKQNGQVVRTAYTLPVKFKLE